MLQTVKVLLNIPLKDNSKDEIIDVLLDILTRKAKNYCNLSEVPEELEEIIAEMAVSLYKIQYGVETVLEPSTPAPIVKTGNVVKKETIGDYTIEYDVGSSKSSSTSSNPINNVIEDYKEQLNCFRVLRFV